MLCYRIAKPAYAATALSGEGARLYGGRWNPPGLRCVYAAESRSLAALELLVHLTGKSRSTPFVILTIDLAQEDIPSLSVDPGWDAMPPGEVSQEAGGLWLQEARDPVIKVPSVIIPDESNILLNPLAPGFEKIRVIEESPLQLDLRLATA